MSSRHVRTSVHSPRLALAAAISTVAFLAPMSATASSAAATPAPQQTVSERAGAGERSQFPNIKTWNRLAGCESDRRWKINTGNGYYGGLQFSSSTWRGFGGGKFAGYAHRARKVEQITIARKVRQSQGWGAWPHCSQKLGLGNQ